MISTTLFEKLNKIAYSVYDNNGFFTVWNDETRSKKLYVVKEVINDLFDICDGDGRSMASEMTEDKVVEFITLDKDMASKFAPAVSVSIGKSRVIKNAEGMVVGFEKIEGETIERIEVSAARVPASSLNSETESIIRSAASKHGLDDVDSFLKKLSRKTDKLVTGTVRKKRQIDLDDLDDQEE